MKLTKILISAAIILATGCVMENPEQQGQQDGPVEILRLHVSSGDEDEPQDNGLDTRTFINYTTARPNGFIDWNSADYIYVFDDRTDINKNRHVFVRKKEGSKVWFECADWPQGQVPAYALFNRLSESTKDADKYTKDWIKITYGGNHGDNIIASLRDRQHIGNVNSFAGNSNIAVGKITGSAQEGYQVTLQNLCGLIKFKTDEKFESVTLKGNNNEIIAGGTPNDVNNRIRVCFNTDGTPFWKIINNAGSREITVTANDIWNNGDNEYYICVLPPQLKENEKHYDKTTNTGVFSEGITLTVKTADGQTFTKTSENPVTVARNKVVNLGVISDPAERLQAWSEGYMDIHCINSGNGECTFFILPDGTTMLVDAGEYPWNASSDVPRRPNAETRPYKVYARYIRHFMPEGKTAIDWCAPSHFHIDHIGSSQSATATHPEGGFPLTGLTGVYNEIPFNRLLDLGYSSYADTDIPPLDGEYATGGYWKTFIDWAVTNKGMQADRFRAGEEQITLLNDKAAYSNFKIFNFIANTKVWGKYLGIFDKVNDTVKAAEYENYKGNPSSAGFHISYGNFDYISAGDLEKAPQNGLADYYKNYVSTRLDVFKANHHFNANSWGSGMREQFDPRVILAHITKVNQPDWTIVDGIQTGTGGTGTDGNPITYRTGYANDIFFTNLATSNADNEANKAKLTDYDGHIVVRVSPGGEVYYVYMLDDTNFRYRIKAVYGPYICE